MMTELQKRDLEQYLSEREIDYIRDFPLCECSSFRIGGRADFLLRPRDYVQLCLTAEYLEENGIRYDVFGRCTDILFDDDGYRGCVVLTGNIAGINVEGNRMSAGCGVPVTYLAQYAWRQSLSGMEFFYGIPGSVGGALYMNAGAYEHSVSEIVRESMAYDRAEHKIVTISGDEHDFGYRRSVYMEKDYIVLGAVFELEKRDGKEIKATMDDYMSRRIAKQPLEYPSAGSVFKRPVGSFAGKLIEEAGLKGRRIGDAVVSDKHAGFIINVGKATSADVLSLIELIRSEVKKNSGVELEKEIIYVPADMDGAVKV